MIPQYLGADLFKLHLTSGKEIELTQDEIKEIVDENPESKKKIAALENDVSKYRDYYHRTDSKLETNREVLRNISKILNDITLSKEDKIEQLLEQQLKIE